jgi:hypothetical protein
MFERAQPLMLEWEAGSDTVGDFTWVGSQALAGKAIILEYLSSHLKGFTLGPVEFVQDQRLKRPLRPSSRTRQRIWLPYDGPMLCEVWITSLVPLDKERSSLRVKQKCDLCGRTQYEIEGVEVFQSRWDVEQKTLKQVSKARSPEQGLIIDENALKDSAIFRISEFPYWIFCTDHMKRFLENRSFTNLRFLEYGDVL